MAKRRRTLRPLLDELDDRCLLSELNPVPPNSYTPSQVTSTYGLDAITFTLPRGGAVKGDGSDESIALIEVGHDPNIQSDLAAFDSQFGLPDPPKFNVIDLAGSQNGGDWELEESMDVEWAHAIAPGASILVVEAALGSTAIQEFQNLMTAINVASNTPGVVAVSMSWGFGEFPGETAYDSNFTTPGITYVAASGDSPGAEYPAASPDVLSVGGTTLHLGASGTFTETAWVDSGGGYSQFEAEPAYQSSVQLTGQRSVPDIAFDGDPNTGVAVYATSPVSGQGTWQLVGGTSLGAPAWAGIIAITDQGRALAGMGSLSGATQTLPSLYALTSADFHSIPAASPPSPWGWPGGAVVTAATANTSTGLGSPKGRALIHDLAASTLFAPLPSPFPTPIPTPAPVSPLSGTPTKHHHHKRRVHSIKRNHPHAATSQSARLVKQHAPVPKEKAGLSHHPG
jgi:hypothetical protein